MQSIDALSILQATPAVLRIEALLPAGFWIAIGLALISSVLYLRARDGAGVNRQLAAIASGHPDLMVAIGPDSRVTWISTSLASRLGQVPAEMSGRMVEDVLPGAFLAALRRSSGWSSGLHQHKLTGADGRGFWVEARAVSLLDGATLLAMHEITAIKQSEAALIRDRDDHAARAFRDPLTGLPNRAAFEPRLEREIEAAVRRGRRVGVLQIDLCDFRDYTACHGTAAADTALVSVSARLKEAAEPGSALFRIEGDCFAAIVSGPESEAPVERQAGRLLQSLEMPLQAPGRPSFEVAAGLAVTTDAAPAGAAKQLVADAAISLAAQKRQGRPGLLRTSNALRQQAEHAARLTAEFERAAAARQLVPYFQPRLSLTDRTISGIRVVPMWQHPGLGIVSIEELSDRGLAAPMLSGAITAVLDDAFAAVSGLGTQVAETPVILSLPYRGGAAREFVDQLFLSIDRHGARPTTLTVLLHRTDDELAQRLTDAGIRLETVITLDRFDLTSILAGGYHAANLSGAGMLEPALGEAMVHFLAAAGAEAIVTGVDAAKQLEWLADCGFDHAEGAAIGAPIPEAELAGFLAGASQQRKSAQSNR